LRRGFEPCHRTETAARFQRGEELLESVEERAGDVVVEAYAHKRNSIDAPYKLRPFDEEIEVKVIAEDDPVKLVLTAFGAASSATSSSPLTPERASIPVGLAL
jgi:hypothetical protein